MIGKIKQFIGMTSILAVLVLFFSCDPTANNPTLTSHNVKVYLTEDQAVTLQVEDGNTLASLATFETPSMDGYSFVSLVTGDGIAVGLNDPITSDMTLYVKFRNSVTDEEGKTTVTVYCTDGTKTVTSTSTTKEDKTTTTTSETTVTKEETTVSETTEETKITTNDDGSVTTQTTTTVTDAQGTTTEKVTEVESGDGTTTTTTTEKTDAEGNTTTEKVTEVTNQDGSITTTTETTDADGNTTTQKTTDDSSAHYWVMKGINTLLAMQNPVSDVVTAKGYFEKAYQVDPNDDEAKVYSSLCNLVDVATSEKIGDFVKEHLGLANYPKDFETLLKGEWLNEDVYINSTYNFGCWKYSAVELTEEEIEDGLADYDYYDWYLKAKVSSDGEWECEYNLVDRDTYVKWDSYQDYEKRMSLTREEKTGQLFGPMNTQNLYNISHNREYCILDESGSCFVCYADVKNSLNSMSEDEKSELNTYLESAKIYKLSRSDEEFEYKVDSYIKAPKFNTTFSNNWYKLSVEQPENLTFIFLANLLEGNTNGLSDAHDDLYSAIFEGDDYKAFVSKIESVNSSITIPRNVSKAIGLNALFGDSNITLGKAELKLLESVLNVYKAVMEYMQAYSFNTDLSILKTDWMATFGDAQSAMKFCVENFKNYDAKIDPIANGLLTVRNADKITASKNTLISVIDDAYAAYNSIIATDSTYPTAITSILDGDEGHVIRDGVLQLRQALVDGGKLYLPEQFFVAPASSEGAQQGFQFPTEWPTDGNYWIDIGKIFTAGTFSRENLIELDSNNRPVLYKLKYSGGSAGNKFEVLGKIETAEDMQNWMKYECTSSYNGSEWSYENYGVGINFKGQEILLNISSLLSEDQVNDMVKYPYMPTTMGMFIYQFYYGGLDEYFDKLVQASGNTTQGE